MTKHQHEPYPDTCYFSLLLELPFPHKLKVGPPPPIQLAHAPEADALIKEAAETTHTLSDRFLGMGVMT